MRCSCPMSCWGACSFNLLVPDTAHLDYFICICSSVSHLSVCPSIHLSAITHPSIYLIFVSLSLYPSILPSTHLQSIYPSIQYLSICLSNLYLSICSSTIYLTIIYLSMYIYHLLTYLSVFDWLFRKGREEKWGKKRKKQDFKWCFWFFLSTLVKRSDPRSPQSWHGAVCGQNTGRSLLGSTVLLSLKVDRHTSLVGVEELSLCGHFHYTFTSAVMRFRGEIRTFWHRWGLRALHIHPNVLRSLREGRVQRSRCCWSQVHTLSSSPGPGLDPEVPDSSLQLLPWASLRSHMSDVQLLPSYHL